MTVIILIDDIVLFLTASNFIINLIYLPSNICFDITRICLSLHTKMSTLFALTSILETERNRRDWERERGNKNIKKKKLFPFLYYIKPILHHLRLKSQPKPPQTSTPSLTPLIWSSTLNIFWNGEEPDAQAACPHEAVLLWSGFLIFLTSSCCHWPEVNFFYLGIQESHTSYLLIFLLYTTQTQLHEIHVHTHSLYLTIHFPRQWVTSILYVVFSSCMKIYTYAQSFEDK